jgi:PAS domain S-box-containing protein
VKNKPAFAASLLLLLFVSGSVWLVLKYVSTERQRDLTDWQARLGIMAESQVHSINDWYAEQLTTLNTLANNPLIQLYASQMVDEQERDDTVRGQLGHLRNLVNATAERSGAFTPISRIRASVRNTSHDGIAIYNTEGMLLATRYFPKHDATVADAYRKVTETAKPYVSGIYQLAAADVGQTVMPRLIIAVPVNSVQSLDETDIRAVVVAVIDPANGLYPLLGKQWVTTHTEESLLVARADDGMRYLSPLSQGFPLFYLSSDDTAAARATEGSSGLVMSTDYRGTSVLATARPLLYSGMTLVQKINEREALSESRAHQQFILTIFLLAVFIVTLLFIAIWRHATSMRLQRAKSRLEARTALLNAVGDSINDHIFLLDHRNRLVFINDALARTFSIRDVDVRGKALNHIFSKEITERLLASKPADISQEVRNKEMRLEMAEKRHDYHVSVIPLRHADYKQSHLYVMHDITELKDAQGRQNRMLDGVIATLVQAIDRHDPHCEHHSVRTREVAVAIAKAMGMPRQRIDALAMAALLANIGKLFIPSSVLTTTEPLTDEEERLMHESVRYGVDILKDLEFDGPVIEFVRQKNEYLDGSGYPQGISGDEIAQESRILAVANAFVAMTSSRAYRSGMPVRQVLDILISEADQRYDRHVIAALFHVTENRSDWQDWQQVRVTDQQPPE